jgi:hypothetical protein
MKRAAADAGPYMGAWIGIDGAGEAWWRLQLDAGDAGRAGVAIGNGVATYRITHWTADENGKLKIELQRDGKKTALDRLPAGMRLDGAGDDVRLRLRHGKEELVFWREDQLIRQRNLLKKRMTASNQ